MKATKNIQARGGFVLVAVMIVTLVIGILAAGVMAHGRDLQAFAIRTQAAVQTEWDAQSALDIAISRFLKEDYSDFTDADVSDYFDFMKGGVTVDITDEGEDCYSVVSKVADVAAGIDRGCQQVYEVNFKTLPASAPLMLLGSDTNNMVDVLISKNNIVLTIDSKDDKILVVGNINLNTIGDIDANVDLLGEMTGNATGDPNINTNDVSAQEVAIIEKIRKEMDVWDSMIDDAPYYATEITSEDLVGGMSLNGDVFYIDGDLVVSDNLLIAGDSGTLIIRGDIDLAGGNKEALEVNGVKLLVEGSLGNAKNQMDLFGSPELIYVGEDVDFKNKGNINLSEGGMVVRGSLEAKNTPVFDKSFIYVDGQLVSKNNLEVIDGVVMAGVLEAGNNIEASFSADAIPEWLAEILESMDEIKVKGGPSSVNRVAWSPYGTDLAWGGRITDTWNSTVTDDGSSTSTTTTDTKTDTTTTTTTTDTGGQDAGPSGVDQNNTTSSSGKSNGNSKSKNK